MKVKAIETYQARDGSDRWKVIFETSDYPLILGEQPDFEAGHEISGDTIRLIQKEHYAYFVPKTDQPQSGRQQQGYGRSPDVAASIETQVVWKGLVDLLIAGKVDELMTSTNPLVMGVRRYAERRLALDSGIPEVDGD